MKHLHAAGLAFALLAIAADTHAQTVKTYSTSLLPGQYSAATVEGPHTGMYRTDGSAIGNWDNPAVFQWPEHVEADFLWFTRGTITWQYPLAIPAWSRIQSFAYTAEIASECPGANPSWPSDVTLKVNGVAVGTWTIPGDPGDRLGLQPHSLGFGLSDYGWLTTWTVDEAGARLDVTFTNPDLSVSTTQIPLPGVTLASLGIAPGQPVAVELVVPGRADGFGLNLYGHTWGDYPVDPTVSVTYTDVIPVVIDVKPGSFPNSVNLRSGGNVPAAILGSATFDVSTVLPATVTLAGVPAMFKDGVPQVEIVDVNLDGLADLVLHFQTTSFAAGSGIVKLAGATSSGAAIEGFDTLTVLK